jgi:hypothetical protein
MRVRARATLTAIRAYNPAPDGGHGVPAAKQRYDWSRYWYPRGSKLELTDDGFLPDPTKISEGFTNREITTLHLVSKIPCTIGLGELGSGKSHAFEDERAVVDRVAKSGAERSRDVNLRDVGSQERFERVITTALETVDDAVPRHVFIDGLDECLLRLSVVKTDLIQQLRRHGTINLYLRIACRTAEWPPTLEEDLRALFGSDSVAVYELAPLTRRDVETAAHANDIEPDQFLKQVADAFAAPFAIRPVTLEFLLGYARRGEAIPRERGRLYEDGCRELCRETPHRDDAHLDGRLIDRERLAIARRIAALTLVTGRPTIELRRSVGIDGHEPLRVEEIADDSTEPVRDAGPITVTRENVDETIRHTTLFAARDVGQLRWAHRSYEEYLAATYFVESHGFPWEQLAPLVTDPLVPNGALIPQLHGLVGWLAALDGAAFDHVLRVEPLLLVSSESVEIDVSRRPQVVTRLLDLARNGDLPPRDPMTDRMLKKLAYPDLAPVLRSALSESAEDVRLLAIDLAVRCDVQGVATELIDIALNPVEPPHVRLQAIRAAGQLASTHERARLRALLDLAPDEDPLDEYRGAALTALWPTALASAELLVALRVPQRPEFFGLYASFLRYHAARHWDAADVPRALRWLADVYEPLTNPPSVQHIPAIETFADSLVLRAWDALTDPSIMPLFATATIPRLRRFGALVSDEAGLLLAERMRQDPQRRRAVIEAVLDVAHDRGVVGRLALGHDPMVGRADLKWLVARIDASADAEERTRLLELVRVITSYGIDSALLEALYMYAQESPALAAEYRWLLEGISLDSPDAAMLREHYLEEQQRLAAEAASKEAAAARAGTIPAALAASEAGDATAFRGVVRALVATCPPNTLHPYEVDLRRTPGWAAADEADRARIVNAAYRYLAETAAAKDFEGAHAAARGLFLVMLEDADRIHQVARETWERWMSTIFAIPIMSGFRDLKSPILRFLLLQARDAFHAALVQRIRRENAEHGSVSILADLDECWDAEITATVAQVLETAPLTPASVRAMLTAMLRHDSVNASPIASRLLADSADDPDRLLAVATAAWLCPTPDLWTQLWLTVADDATFTGAVVGSVMTAPDLPEALYLKRLTEDQLGDLYLWLNARYPRGEDPPPTSGALTERQQVALARDAIVVSISGRGTAAASGALRRIADAAPDTPDIRAYIRAADARRRDASWQPLAPREVLRLAADRTTRVVRNADQLLSVVLDVLSGLEAHFQGRHSPVLAIWNEVLRKKTKKKGYSPKDEHAFARRVAEHFEMVAGGRRLVVNREVKIREGEFTDVMVDAIGPEDDRFTVVIECKGCWHREVRTAIQTQLVEKYLRNLGTYYGVYLVGFFHCARWLGKAHVRKKACPGDQAQLDAFLGVEAQRLSLDRLRIRSVVIDCSLHF